MKPFGLLRHFPSKSILIKPCAMRIKYCRVEHGVLAFMLCVLLGVVQKRRPVPPQILIFLAFLFGFIDRIADVFYSRLSFPFSYNLSIEVHFPIILLLNELTFPFSQFLCLIYFHFISFYFPVRQTLTSPIMLSCCGHYFVWSIKCIKNLTSVNIYRLYLVRTVGCRCYTILSSFEGRCIWNISSQIFLMRILNEYNMKKQYAKDE